MLSSRSKTNLSPPEFRPIPIASVRKDGQTQHRTKINPAIVLQYSELMRAGVTFPPIRVWWDGDEFWLSDGFHRVAAAEKAGFSEISTEVHQGTVYDAQWDSYNANSLHGIRPTAGDTRLVIGRALLHPNAAGVSNVELARHLHIPEATVRRWRNRLAPNTGSTVVRIAKREESTYTLKTVRSGRYESGARSAKSKRQLRVELDIMKSKSSGNARRVLNIVHNWTFGAATHEECLDAIERLMASPGSQ
jgi:hypothetical protein